MPRFSLRWLIALMTVAACVALAAGVSLRWPSLLIHGLLTAALFAASLAALFGKGPDRAFFLGAAIVGWVLFVDAFILTWRSTAAGPSYAIKQMAADLSGVFPNSFGGGIALCSVATALAALAGGWFSRWVYRRYRE